ncbi:MAG: FliH/SctL family protein [Chitinivibrionales bacterium]
MADSPLSSEDVTSLIDHLLKTKDPATVGLKKIIKTKIDQDRDFPLQSLSMEEFESGEQSSTVFSEAEKRILELEKRCRELEKNVAKEKLAGEQKVKEAFAKGIAEGKAQGEKDGFEKASKDFQNRITTLESRIVAIFSRIDEEKKLMILNSHRMLLNFTFLLARKIINREIQTDSDIVIGVVKKALGYISDREKLTIRVSPDDLESVTGKKNMWLSVNEQLENVTITTDERIEHGGCIIESPSGIADARIDIQLGELRDVVDKAWDDMMTGEPPIEDIKSEQPGEQERI